MTIFELCAMIDYLRELERNNTVPPEAIIDFDRDIRELLFGNDELTIRYREIAQDYYIATLRRTA